MFTYRRVLNCLLIIKYFYSKFLTCLATRSKLLIAGLHGDVVGLGVMILPLFDIIIANESTTLSTPYGKLGCIPEATTFLNSGNFLHKALVIC